MNLRPPTGARGRALALVVSTVLALGLAACSISTEENPRPITRETTIVQPPGTTP